LRRIAMEEEARLVEQPLRRPNIADDRVSGEVAPAVETLRLFCGAVDDDRHAVEDWLAVLLLLGRFAIERRQIRVEDDAVDAVARGDIRRVVLVGSREDADIVSGKILHEAIPRFVVGGCNEQILLQAPGKSLEAVEQPVEHVLALNW